MEYLKPKVGISTCLLGKNVRYNGSHKLDYYIKDILGDYVDFIPVCPEVEAGFGVPREAVHLHETPDGIRMITEKSDNDLTESMLKWIEQKMKLISSFELSGYILKSKSPSCGIFRTRIYRDEQGPSLNGRGLYAKALIQKFPDLLVEEEGRLHNPEIRENFINMLFIRQRWISLAKNKTIKGLMKFHERVKYLLMSHSPAKLKKMGNIVANSNEEKLEEIFTSYCKLLNEAFSKLATKKSNRNVLDHIMGYFKKDLSADEKKELKELISNYSKGLVPLIVPITLLNHYVRKYNQSYLKDQYYLNPHPMELMLRNHL